MALGLPMGLLKAPGVGVRLALTIVGSHVWGVKKTPMKDKKDGWGLGLRWPPFDGATHQ